MSHKKSINKRLAAAKAAAESEGKDITSGSVHVQSKHKKNK